MKPPHGVVIGATVTRVTELTDADLFSRLEVFYDAVPRDRARVEPHGPFVLFVPEGTAHPFYARPTLGAEALPTVDDVAAVRARQRALGQPEAFEWVHETTPGLLAVAEAAGLSVLRAPLLVLDPSRLQAPEAFSSVPVRLLDPAHPGYAADLATFRAVAGTSFAAAGTAVGEAGRTERDAAFAPIGEVEVARERARAGQAAFALAETAAEGALAGGAYQRAGDVVEVVGVATLPVARRQGLGAAVTAALARRALDTGAAVVFLSAGSEAIAQVYGRVGFRRVGTACIAQGPAAA